jgi:alpha-L-rhamnosidase
MIVLACFAFLANAAPLAPTRLRLEYIENPRGVDVLLPRFSWALNHQDKAQVQSGYQVQVTKMADDTLVWDSGKVLSNKSLNVEYAGSHLESDADYTWKVCYFDTAGVQSPFSHAATFSMGLIAESDWKGATWIGITSTASGRQLRTSFQASSVKRAVVYAVGLGYYKLYVNGQKVSVHELGPFTTFEKRVYYETYDVTAMIANDGSNALGVSLGNGWYSQPRVAAHTKGAPKLLLRLSLTMADGTTKDIVSNTDGDWMQHAGPVVMDDIYNGETYNASMETAGWTEAGYDSATNGWTAVKESVPAPSANTTIASHAVLPPIKVGRTYSPCDMWESSPGVYVFDFCQNMAGFTTLQIPAGLATGVSSVSMLHAEAVHGPPPAAIYHHYSNTAETATYITRGDSAAVKYTPLFTYMGFRYVQLTGYPGTPDFTTLTAHFVHTAFETTGSVSFSDPLLDQVQHITRMASMSNFMSIPTDCPQRERFGWLGDAQLSAETTIHNFDMAGAYTAFISLINDSQDPVSGNVQDCVPWYGHGHSQADPAWGSAYTFIADWVGTYYDDDAIFKRHYTGIKAHLEALRTQATADNANGLLTFSWWGDWCPPSGCRLSKDHRNSALVSSFMYLKQIRIMAKMAGILGHSADADEYKSLDMNVSAAFTKAFYNPTTHIWNEPQRESGAEELTLQTCASLGIELGLGDKSQDIAALVDDVMVKNDGHLDVGIVGVKYLLPSLSRAGRTDVALQVAQTKTIPGYVYMVLQGATTLWETWTGTRYQPTASWNHIMFGANSEWYYKWLAGIRQADGGRGFDKLLLAPQVWTPQMPNSRGICGNLSSVDASMTTPRGPIIASWSCGPEHANQVCSSVAEKEVAKVTCPGSGNVITGISFADYGTPVGSCSTGFATGQCGSASAPSIVSKLCVGKQTCSIVANNTVFGGDPCFDTKKELAVVAECKDNFHALFSYNVTVPVGSTASVRLPKFNTTGVQVTEDSTAVWSNGKFVPVPGVASGSEDGGAVQFEVGSGDYSFTMRA